MKSHTDTEASHRQLGYTWLKEGTSEITTGQCSGLLEEAISLVGVRQVC